MTKPRFEHDCLQCVFLGPIDLEGLPPFDGYYCQRTPVLGGTLILRQSSDPSDYGSLPVHTFLNLPSGIQASWAGGRAFQVALARARTLAPAPSDLTAVLMDHQARSTQRAADAIRAHLALGEADVTGRTVPHDSLAERLTEHFGRATQKAVADLHAQGVSAHGEVDGQWREIPPPKGEGHDE